MTIDRRIYGTDAEPTQIYSFSDVYGGATGSPLKDPNPEEFITTDLRSSPHRKREREFDIHHAPHVVDHILRSIVRLRDEMFSLLSNRGRQERVSSHVTGVFINSAPRTNCSNGKPFYVAETDNGVRIVSTPIEALSTIRERIIRLGHLPNRDNGLYGNAEQFRSSYAPELLFPDHELVLEADDVDIIPQYDRNDWHVAYIDRFGNIVTYVKDPTEQWEQISQADTVDVQVGRNLVREVLVGSSLGTNEAGKVSIYQNGGIDIARKWKPNESPEERLERSAYSQFSSDGSHPRIGDKVTLA